MDAQKEYSSVKKVMVVIDESDCSYNALMWVLQNLKESFTNHSPIFIFATQPLAEFSFAVTPSLGFARLYSSSLPPTGDLVIQYQEINKKVSLGLLEKARTICSSYGVNVKTFTEAADPKEAICRAVQEHNINLLVVGDNSSGFFHRALRGSTLAEHCLSNANCPVLVVKKPI